MIKILFLILITFTCIKVSAYDIKVDNTLNIGTNNTIIFNEDYISPGFTKDYNITVVNESDKILIFSIIDIEVIFNNSLFSGAVFTFKTDNKNFNYDVKVYGNSNPILSDLKEIRCINIGEESKIDFNLYLDSTLDNNYQNKEFEVDFVFQLNEVVKCPSQKKEEGSLIESLPKTGESYIVYWILYVMITITILIILIIKKKIEKEKKNEKNKAIID